MKRWVNIAKSPQGGIEVQIIAGYGSTGHITEWARVAPEDVAKLIKRITEMAGE